QPERTVEPPAVFLWHGWRAGRNGELEHDHGAAAVELAERDPVGRADRRADRKASLQHRLPVWRDRWRTPRPTVRALIVRLRAPGPVELRAVERTPHKPA